MNSRIDDHLIIIQEQQEGCGWLTHLSQVIEERGQDGGKRRRLR